MIIRIHGFEWKIYSGRVMPALGQWLTTDDDIAVYQLFRQTRCSLEEQQAPESMQHLLTWPRAQSFVKQLPRSAQIRREYQLLCSAAAFTRLSDRYAHLYTPRLHQHAEALRTVWGALIEEYCLPWQRLMINGQTPQTPTTSNEPDILPHEILTLLHAAGLSALVSPAHSTAQPDADDDETATDEGVPLEERNAAIDTAGTGVIIGRFPTTLHLRGWLASISVRAMALFELLATGRRSMPFGYLAGDPFGCYNGYLTPDETRQLALCLSGILIPDRAVAEEDYQLFRSQQTSNVNEFRVIDEVLPAHADVFAKAVQIAAQQGLGLICSVG